MSPDAHNAPAARTLGAIRWPAALLVLTLWGGAGAFWVFLELPWIALAAVAVHLIEIPLWGVPTGLAAGHGAVRSAVMTLIFGFVWWLPIRRALTGPRALDGQ